MSTGIAVGRPTARPYTKDQLDHFVRLTFELRSELGRLSALWSQACITHLYGHLYEEDLEELAGRLNKNFRGTA